MIQMFGFSADGQRGGMPGRKHRVETGEGSNQPWRGAEWKVDVKMFGALVNTARQKARLTQAALAEQISIESGFDISAAAVGNWCRGERLPGREMLLALLATLYREGGIASLAQINAILRAAGAGALHTDERVKWFGGLVETSAPPREAEVAAEPAEPSFWFRVLVRLLNPSASTLNTLHIIRAQGPQQRWTGLFLFLVSAVTKGWSAERVLWLCVGVILVCLTWVVVYPPLRWMPLPPDLLQALILVCGGGCLAIPLLVAGCIRTRDDPYWKAAAKGKERDLRRFTHLGAMLGFQVGYSLIFLVTLVPYHLHLSPLPVWCELLLSTSPLVWAVAGARQVPYNYQRAYGEVRFTQRELPIVVAALLLGPAIGGLYLFAFPLFVNPLSGAILVLGAFMGLAVLTIRYRTQGDGVIPAHVWTALLGGGFILYQIYLFTPWVVIFALAGIVGLLVYLTARGRIRITAYGLLGASIILIGLLVVLQVNLTAGRILAIGVIMGWILVGRAYFWFPVVFWVGVVLSGVCVYLWSIGGTTEFQMVLIYGASYALLLLGDRLWEQQHHPRR
jgi:transcriptional regulator with XRE-family HTH domain